jgi:hypothetical protein
VLQEVEDGHEVGLQIATAFHDELGVAVAEQPEAPQKNASK